MSILNKISNKLSNMQFQMMAQAARKTPVVSNRVCIMTINSQYTCNPKYIYEAWKKADPDWEFIWITKENIDLKDYPKDVKVLPLFSKEAVEAVYSAKIWLDNGLMFSEYFDKKPEQIHLQTMHGSLGIKKLGNGMVGRSKTKHGQQVIYRESHDTDYVITNSKFEEDVFRTVFWKNTPMVRLGHARTDVLFSDNQEKIDAIRETLEKEYGVPKDKKIVLYGPTFRRDLTLEDLNLDYERICVALKERFGDDYVVLFRFHARSTKLLHLDDAKTQYMYDVTYYPDIQELMLVTDVAVTDYSSWIFDYVVTGKKGFIYATDYDRYETATGLCYPLEATPFPVCHNNDEFVKNVASFDEKEYAQKVADFLADKEAVDDGKSAERIVAWIHTLL